MSLPFLSPSQPLGDEHLLRRQRINGNNCLYKLKKGNSWYKHYNALSRLKQDMRAKKSAFEEHKDDFYTVHKTVSLHTDLETMGPADHG